MNSLTQYNEKTFENIKHIDEYGNEYWEDRELQQILEYKEWRYFSAVIEKAQVACSRSNNNINHHFGVNTKIVKTGVLDKKKIKKEEAACDTHYKVGKAVRNVIKEIEKGELKKLN